MSRSAALEIHYDYFRDCATFVAFRIDGATCKNRVRFKFRRSVERTGQLGITVREHDQTTSAMKLAHYGGEFRLLFFAKRIFGVRGEA